MEEIKGYKVLKHIGKGGMASVYKGIQISLNRPVAIKVLSQKLMGKSFILKRFYRESLIIAKLNHPGIIHVIDRGVTNNKMPFFIMEFIEGIELKAMIKENQLNLKNKLKLIIQICRALSFAHKNGVIHRDIKPANILIDKDGNSKILDFGIANLFGDQGNEPIMGTPAYMSPEQKTPNQKITELSDIFSFGVLMFELLSGIKPNGNPEVLSAVTPELPLVLQKIILSCLEKDPKDRPPSADFIQNSILKIFAGSHINSKQKSNANEGIFNIKDKFKMLDVIKESQEHGSVYLFENKIDQKIILIKKLPSKSTGYMEAKLLTTLKHKNIINILGTTKNEGTFIIISEYLSGGSLQDRLLQPFKIEKFSIITKQICEALYFAHKNRIIHGNLRPSNIVFSEGGLVKLTDFGLTEHYVQTKQQNWYKNSKKIKSVQADIVSTGIIFYRMLTGFVPKFDKNKIFSPHRLFVKLPLNAQDLILKMLPSYSDKHYNSFAQILQDINSFI